MLYNSSKLKNEEVKLMDIERQIKDIGRLFNYVLTRRPEEGPQIVAFEEIDNEDCFEQLLSIYLYEGNYNAADNLIFAQLEATNTPEIRQMAQDFYQILLTRTDKELIDAHFVREEVLQSLEDLKKYNSNPKY